MLKCSQYYAFNSFPPERREEMGKEKKNPRRWKQNDKKTVHSYQDSLDNPRQRFFFGGGGTSHNADTVHKLAPHCPATCRMVYWIGF